MTTQPATADAVDSSTVKKLIATVEGLRDDLEAAHTRIDELETELSNYRAENERDKAEIRQKVESVRETAENPTSEDATPRAEADETGSQNPETPLERICALPEHVADRELTANQERARFIAKDVRDYAEKAPAGFVMDSSTIRRVITAKEEKTAHAQTVARVMKFMDELGKDDVELKKRRGRKFLVVDPNAADRYEAAAAHSRCEPGQEPTTGQSVIGPV